MPIDLPPPNDIPALIRQCAPTVAPDTMAAIIRVESGGKPNLIGRLVRDKARNKLNLDFQPKTREQAVQWATWLYERGYNFDAGLAQINSANWPKLGLTPQTVFDPCTNIRAGATVLTRSYRQAAAKYGSGLDALHKAISAYNTGNYAAGFGNGYVGRVASAAGAKVPLSPVSTASKSPSRKKKPSIATTYTYGVTPLNAPTTIDAFNKNATPSGS